MDIRNREDPDTLPFKVTFITPYSGEKVLAAFRLETTYRDFLAKCHEVTVSDVVESLVEDARQSTINIELAGVEDDAIAVNGLLPYNEAIQAFEKGIQELKALKGHCHEWVTREDNGASYCCTCGMPGDI